MPNKHVRPIKRARLLPLSTKPFPINLLPYELVCEIFILSSNPQLALVCPQLQHCSEHTKMDWLLYKCQGNKIQAVEEGLKYRFFSISLLEKFDQLQDDNDNNDSNNDKDGSPKRIRLDNRMLPPRLFISIETHPLVRQLLERGASPHKPQGYPIIKSAQLGHLEMVKTLVSFGADATVKNNMALRVSAARENTKIVLFFLDNLGVKPDSETLKHCVQKNLWDMVKLLVDHGAVPDMSTVHIA
ncbi:hypothetical protein BDA99DRAFT_529471 [Phascolomyces articulosus]|uniref:Ankyrin repeat protein n=1 Tax=Phascolomyces articulosus TaxID=60185 RepID=A0AAD5P7H3_9FUNG|nr:hypothetical protein BDA99DRAFT_529471 [Phascolomyces articulosus]